MLSFSLLWRVRNGRCVDNRQAPVNRLMIRESGYIVSFSGLCTGQWQLHLSATYQPASWPASQAHICIPLRMIIVSSLTFLFSRRRQTALVPMHVFLASSVWNFCFSNVLKLRCLQVWFAVCAVKPHVWRHMRRSFGPTMLHTERSRSDVCHYWAVLHPTLPVVCMN